MDKETFRKMWDMSGAEATQDLFMRLPQEEYYAEERTGESILKFYPAVRFLAGLLYNQTLTSVPVRGRKNRVSATICEGGFEISNNNDRRAQLSCLPHE